MSIDQRLAELGITLPQAAAPVASYVPAVEAGGLLHISGQVSFAEDGSLIKGRLGEDMELEAGQAAARRLRPETRMNLFLTLCMHDEVPLGLKGILIELESNRHLRGDLVKFLECLDQQRESSIAQRS